MMSEEYPDDAPTKAAIRLPQRDWVGEVIDGRYRILEKIGEGGMGSVYAATHLKLGKKVALKIIHPDLIGDQEMATRFAREAMASGRLEHPNVVSALDFGTLPDGAAYLAMQFAKGRSLEQALETDGRFGWADACDIAAQVADAMGAAHAQGIIHRDLKPENILLEKNENGIKVRVLDFGIARVPKNAMNAPAGAAPRRSLTRVGTVMGTPGYMAPEQAVGDDVDVRADIYCLGIVLWEMVAGRALFPMTDLTEIVAEQYKESVPPLGKETGDATIPATLESLVVRCLRRKRDQRPESAVEIRDALRELIFDVRARSGMRPAANAPREDDTRKITTGAGKIAVTPDAGVDTKKQKMFMAAGALALLLIGGIAIAALGGDDSTVTPLDEPVMEMDEGPTAEELVIAIEDVLAHGSERRRQAAANLLLSVPADDIPRFAVLAAQIELEPTCTGKRTLLRELADLQEPHSLPLVMRFDTGPQTGIRCLARVNARLKRTLNAIIEAEAGAAGPEEGAEANP